MSFLAAGGRVAGGTVPIFCFPVALMFLFVLVLVVVVLVLVLVVGVVWFVSSNQLEKRKIIRQTKNNNGGERFKYQVSGTFA